MIELTKNSQAYYAKFEELRPVIEERSTSVMNVHRASAIQKFKELGGFPTTKIEDYKYTNLDAFFDAEYTISTEANDKTHADFKGKIPLEDAYNLYLVNGSLLSSKAVEELQKAGVVVCTFKQAATEYSELFQQYYNKKAQQSEHSIVALNTAFVQDGLFIYVPENVALEKPIQLLHYLYGEEKTFINGRKLIIVEKNAEVKIVSETYTLVNQQFLTNTVTELFVAENAKAEYYVLQNQLDQATILSNLLVTQKRDSVVNANTISLNAKAIRNNVTVDLEDKNCDNHTYGLYLPNGKETVDNFSAINHIAPHCNSWEHFKGILDEKSQAAFCGRIHVYKDAQKTEAYQTNNNLILTNSAKANTKPQLIIEADDVSCSHGATVGQLDEEAIFYLQSRGIPYKEAYKMMMSAFVSDITEKISITELRESVENWIRMKMEGEITYFVPCETK